MMYFLEWKDAGGKYRKIFANYTDMARFAEKLPVESSWKQTFENKKKKNPRY